MTIRVRWAWAVAAVLVVTVGGAALIDNLRNQGTPISEISEAQDGSVTVDRVIDGDTFVTTRGLHVRILGLDAPETQNGHHDCYGIEATAALIGFLYGTGEGDDSQGRAQVTLNVDPEQGDQDRYGRSLRYVINADGQDVTEQMIAGGWAQYYDAYPVARSPIYIQAETDARQDRIGGWTECSW